MYKSALIILTCITLSSSTVPVSPRVIGGVATDIFNHPYLVSVQNSSQHICGGAIISNRHILTAASPITGIASSLLSVRVGSTFHNTGGTVVLATIVNTSYIPNSLTNDYAVITLATNLVFNMNVIPIPIATSTSVLTTNQLGTFVGWGFSRPNGVLFDGLLRTDLYVILPANCRTLFGNTIITDTVFCAGTYYRNICNGDFGGPLVSNGTLIGVAFWGINCGRNNLPAVFIDVAKYSADINTIITSTVPVV